MDQKRFIGFLMLSLATLILVQMIFPPPPPVDRPAAAPAVEEPGQEDAPAGVAPGAAPAEGQPVAPPPLAERLAGAEAEVPLRFLTLGSLDHATGHRMLVTFTSRGAAVHRAELASPRYRDLHDRAGYLGALELVDAAGGAEVQVVGAGTPAASAGIQPGDVITGIDFDRNFTAIDSAARLSAVFARTKPRDEVTLHVRRGEAEPQTIAVRLVRKPLALLRPEIENYQMREAEPPEEFVDPPSFLVRFSTLEGKRLSESELARMKTLLEVGNWEVAEESETSVAFRRALPELGLEIVKRYRLELVPTESVNDVNYPGYDLDLEIELHNLGDTPQSLAYQLDGPTGMPLEGWWYAHKVSQRWFSAAGLRDVSVRFFGSQMVQIDCSKIASGDVEPMGQDRALAYAGVDGQYFSAVLIPKKESSEEIWFDTTEAIVVGPKPDARTPTTFTNVTSRMTRRPIELAAGGVHRDAFEIFLGPKRPELLAQYQAAGQENYSLRDLLYYGWPIFGAVARAMLVVLHFFYDMVGNYGLAIIMLTVLVRGAMFPISYKQTQNIARMQALKPEMDKITEKYKTDMQKRSQAMQELYRKHKINPLGGCLPMFLQLPIFIGLYRALMVDVELRQSPLFSEAIRWCSNLAAPDMFLDWSWLMPRFITDGHGMFALGPYLNILPLVTVALFLVTQKIAMPAPTNEQAVLQQKLMKYMTAFMGLLFFKVASGLCLYFIASSLWGIAERKLLPKSAIATAEADGGAGRTGSGGKGSDGGGPRAVSPKPGANGSAGEKKRRKAKRRK